MKCHAIVGSVLENHDEVEKITLIPRGGAKGLTWFTPEEDQMLLSRSQLLARIITTLAGRVTEQIIFGDAEITTVLVMIYNKLLILQDKW